MKLVFMGTPDFAVPSLKALHGAGHFVDLVITQPDRARNRGKKISEPPVKIAAGELGIEVIQPEAVKNNGDLFRRIAETEPEAIIVAAYGRILPPEILEMPRLGCINVHASLLPRFRGAAPMQHAILMGDEKTGVTIMKMEKGLDTGGMYAKGEVAVERKFFPELSEELSQLGAELLVKTLPEIEGGLQPEIQNEEEATYAPIIRKEDGRVDLRIKTASEIERMVRAYDPWPGAFCDYSSEVMKIKKASALEGGSGYAPGTVLNAGSEGLDVATKEGILRIEELQLPGKKAMTVDSFLRGNRIPENGFKK